MRRIATLSALTAGLLIACKDEAPRAKAPGATPPATVATPTAPPVAPPVPPSPPATLPPDPAPGAGETVWATSIGGLGIDAPRAIAVGADGAAYVVGYIDGETTFGKLGTVTATPPAKDFGATKAPPATSDAFVVKLDASGEPVWYKTMGGTRSEVATGVAVGADGSVVVVGNFLDTLVIGPHHTASRNSDDGFIAKFDAAGNPLWLRSVGGEHSDGFNVVLATADGGWLVGGSFADSIDVAGETLKSKGGTDAMLIKLTGDGQVSWAKQFGGSFNDSVQRLAIDPSGDIVLQGQFQDRASWGGDELKAGGGSDGDVVLAKYDARGNHRWSQRFGDAFNDVSGGVTVDPAGNITMTGSFDKSLTIGEQRFISHGESDIFLASFAPDGTPRWAKAWGGEREDIGYGLGSDRFGNVVMAGWFQQRVDFPRGPITAKGNKDIVLAKFNAAGEPVWLHTYGDRDQDQSRALTVTADGETWLTGIYRFELAMGPKITLRSIHAPDDQIPPPDMLVARVQR